MPLYNSTYRIETTRLKNWDYTAEGVYFITICTKNKHRFFGKLRGSVVLLSDPGIIAAEEWVKTGDLRSNITLDQWIIMPNHIHGIIVIHSASETTRRVVSTRTLVANSVGAIIGQYKAVVTRRIHQLGETSFAWQPRFYDHIIRNNHALNKIRQYIIDNPQRSSLQTSS